MKSPVYFTPFANNTSESVAAQKITHLIRSANLKSCFQENDFVAIKLHFGEIGNRNTISPRFVRYFVDLIKQHNANAFLTDTCVLYKSQRSDAVNHLQVAEKQGYTLTATGAPVVIADGLFGNSEIEVEIPGKLYSKVAIATEAVLANAMFALTHVTGHMETGLGGTLKNLGMGLASRKGKLRQHSAIKPQIIASNCTGCGVCVSWCPTNAISLSNQIAVIDDARCIGCGQCLTMCRYSAIRYNWAVSSTELQKRVAEHALGAIINKRDKVGFISFLTAITRDCDCLGRTQKPITPDIGIIASKDPVAIDAAALALIQQATGKTLSALAYPNIDDTVQLEHAEAIGLGSRDFEIITVD